jgi:hypothetical protein
MAALILALPATELGGQTPRMRVLEPWVRPDKDASEGAKAMLLAAPRNGFASGQVHIQAGADAKALRAALGDLKSAQGGVIPSTAVRIRYGRGDKVLGALLDAPTPDAASHVVWVTVNVPAEAKPGVYAGDLQIGGIDPPATVAVELTVYGWKVPSPREWKTTVNMLQSPESVAGHYKVGLWSDQHFKMLEKSMGLLAEAGNDVFGFSVVGWNMLGNDPVVVFRKQAGRWVAELKFLDRYLQMYDRIVGKPRFVAVHAWTYGSRSGTERGNEPVRILELQGDKLVDAEIPPFGPQTEDLWRSVFDHIRDVVKKLGWREEGLLLGTSGDSYPLPATIDFFNRVAPGFEWRSITHGTGCPKWGWSRGKRTQPNGMVVGYLEMARWVPSGRVWSEDRPVVANSRDHIGTDPFNLFALASFNASAPSAGYGGYCWKGLDYWTYTTPEGTQRNALNTYVSFGNVVGGTPRALSAPGPQGAVATPSFETMREGTQACEAVWAIRDNLAALYPQKTQQCDVAELFLQGALKANPADANARELEVVLVFHGDQIMVHPYAPRWNTGGPGPCHAKADRRKDGATYDIEFSLKDDAWVPGGAGQFAVEVKLDGENYAGTYKGQFKGVPTSGRVVGTYRAKGYTVPVGPPPARTELSSRCESAIDEYFKAVCLDKRAREIPANLRALLCRLYALATETSQSLAGN